ncbi:MAG: hypothetical protein KF856_04855 [Cyclobacteriaceae bacterium]|nr:hypothetical protein [Cyclobacteriaceae bacterium]
MKNIQTGFLKILGIVVLIMTVVCGYTQTPASLLQQADSLYAKKQFTQSFELYNRIHKAGQYSPAMFLRMAFIQEGLNKPGLALYYLNLYYLASGDAQTLIKMDELAAKNGLSGYENTQINQVREIINRYRLHMTGAIASFIILVMAVALYQHKKGNKPMVAPVLTLVALVFLGLFVNFSQPDPTVIITGANTLVMSGPSAGASAVGLLKEGNKVRVKNKEDVWLKVVWADQYVYVRESQVQEITL